MTMRVCCFCMSLWFSSNDSYQPEVSVIKCHQLEGSGSRLTGFRGRLQGEVHVEAETKGSDFLLASVKLPMTLPVCGRDPGLRAVEPQETRSWCCSTADVFGILGSEYERISWVGKDLRRSQSNLLVMAGAALGSDQVMQGFIQLGLEKLRGRRLHKLLVVEQFSLILSLEYQWCPCQQCCQDNQDLLKEVSSSREENEGSSSREHHHHLSWESPADIRSSPGRHGAGTLVLS